MGMVILTVLLIISLIMIMSGDEDFAGLSSSCLFPVVLFIIVLIGFGVVGC